MEKLDQMKCVACRAGAPRVSDEELEVLLRQVPDWKLIEVADIRKLQRVFQFQNFTQALEFTQEVGEMAEAEGHHPAILTEWGRTTVTWWTHKIKGLHQNDFIAAAKTDQINQIYEHQ